jgi:hypothetical protein
MSNMERYKAKDKIRKEIIKEAEADRDVYCSVSEMHGGNQYILYTYFKIKDVRIVYAPPEAIGSYGGDIDNWMWPRHTGDFSFLRAYVAPDGSSAEYSEDNVPYHPKVILPISSAGVNEGDFSIMIGFPGRTNRYASSFSLDDLINYYYPKRNQSSEETLAIMDEFSRKDPAIAIKLESSVSGINNGYKKRQGLLEGFRRSNILARKRTDEKQLIDFINADQHLKKKYGHVIPELDSIFQIEMATREKDFALTRMMYSSDLLSMASSVYKWSVEREKPDMERERWYQDRDTTRTIRWLNYSQINLVPEVDRALLEHYIRKAWELPDGQRIDAIDRVFTGQSVQENEEIMKSFLDDLFINTKIGDLDTRLDMFHMTKDELENLNDPMINFAISIRPEQDEKRERSKEISGAESRLEPLLIQAHALWKKYNLYPDANGSMRFNYGEVKGYNPRDAVKYDYLTGLTGVMEKETGKDPFIVPEELKKAYYEKNFFPYLDKKTGDVPICFLTTNDGTGGNSGSPVINGKGELIGLDFDSNYEGVAADYLHESNLARSIVVDIRYVLFVVDKVYHLDALMQEMTVH